MGYYTKFNISIQGKPLNDKELANIEKLTEEANKLSGELKKIALKGIEDAKGKILDNPEEIIAQQIGYNPFQNRCKWYEVVEDMRIVSEKYPQTLFILEGEGDQSGDIWKKYFLNGKMQKADAKITFDEFDENKLQ